MSMAAKLNGSNACDEPRREENSISNVINNIEIISASYNINNNNNNSKSMAVNVMAKKYQ
jgi:hypothetical protein